MKALVPVKTRCTGTNAPDVKVTPRKQTCSDINLAHSHGGPRQTAKPADPGMGRQAKPVRAATTRNIPRLQHGHNPTSTFATRAMKAWTDSRACGFDYGICRAMRAAASLTPLQLLANTPK